MRLSKQNNTYNHWGIQRDTMTELAELGLSSYEEKVYRTLLVTDVVTATELSDISGVPKGRIYDVLNSLTARKLI